MIKTMIKNLAGILLLFTSLTLHAQLRLPPLVSDSMVLQRDVKLKIWGWASKKSKIQVSFNNKKYSTVTTDDGKWMVLLPPFKAGGPYTMTITGDGSNVTLRDILIGDVWLCAGQSNMVHNLDLHKDRYRAEVAAANYPQVRQFLVPTNPVLASKAENLPGGSWKAATPQNVLRFSVVGYFFAKGLHEKYKVPVGFINASVGGTPVEAWTSEEGLKEFPDVISTITSNKDTASVNRVNRQAAVLRQQVEKRRTGDEGMIAPKKWYDTSYVSNDWHVLNIPGYWEEQGNADLNGVVWYRRDIQVPAAMTAVPARLSLGRIIDADEVYVNGKRVGNTTYQYPQRRYNLTAGTLKPGKNTIVVRVTNYGGKGGFVHDKPYYLAAGKDTLDLKGYWKYKVGEVFVPQTENTAGISIQNQPAALFNGMVAPYINYAIKGAVWYQGESNTGRASAYEKLLPALINDWRHQWQQPALPFLYVQLPNFMDVNYLPTESQWAALREAQRKTLQVSNTAMVTAIDLGEWNDIHPGNKKPIGERLALAAQHVAYGDKQVVYSGPSYTSATVDGNKVTLQFTNVGSGLISRDGSKLKWFAVAGEDKKFVWAETQVLTDKVVLWSNAVSSPVYVRYAWSDNPEDVNFYNKEGLPASPFEAKVANTDQRWHGKKAAVVLTYDDALDVHLDNAIPILDSLGLKATFYLSVAASGSKNRIRDWKRVAMNGHELGNHTLYHPCDGSKPGRSWVSPQNDLSKYTTAQIVRESEMTNVFLESLDGRKERTFAYTCGDTETGEGSFIEAIKNQFVSMRGVSGALNKLETLDLKNLNCYGVDAGNEDQMIAWAEKARDENALLVILFHGVGGGHSLNVDLKKHNNFLKYLKSHSQDYWVTTMLEASKHSIQQTSGK